MIPSEVTSFMHQSLDEIDRLIDKVRYGTRFEVRDLLQVSEAYERFGFRLLELGRIEDAFNQFAQAADCCCRSENNWAVVAEAIQTILRREGYPNPYETLKALTRTGEGVSRETIARFIDTLEVSDSVKAELRAISPSSYTGL